MSHQKLMALTLAPNEAHASIMVQGDVIRAQVIANPSRPAPRSVTASRCRRAVHRQRRHGGAQFGTGQVVEVALGGRQLGMSQKHGDGHQAVAGA